jgi:Ca2+-binding RTX toxin-like protein
LTTARRTPLRAFVASLALTVPLLATATPASGAAWPGGTTVSFADGVNVFGDNLSGLAYQPSGTSAPGVLWAVRNQNPKLFRLLWDGTKWIRDPANGWQQGKFLRYPDGTSAPDAEGVTLATGDPNGVYVATEAVNSSGVSRPGVLRFTVTGTATSLNAADDWNLTADLPGLGANGGPEAITWVPDDFLVSKGFFDEAAAAAYNPASYPGHGRGLFFVGVEQTGQIIAYALNRTTDTFTHVATIASGFPKVMALEYEAESTHLWAVCDNDCNGQHNTLDIAQSGPNDGKFVVTNTYETPGGMAALNNEGFAIAPQAECVGGLKPVIWADDGNTASHSLRQGTLNCTVPPTCLGSTATISGTPGNDTLAGTAGPDVIAGEGGDDTIKGLGANDKICGGVGDDTLSGFDGNDTVNGGSGTDLFGEGSVASGADVLIGGSGIDIVNYGARAIAVSVSIDNTANDGAAGEADNVRTDVENLVGGSAGDTLTTSGSILANRLFGRAGNDTIDVADGILGNDTIDGGADVDVCTADAGDATLGCP